MDIHEIIKKSLCENNFIYGIFTSPRNKKENPYKKITARYIVLKNENIIQLEKFTDTKVFHENLKINEAFDILSDFVINDYKNANIFTTAYDYQIIASKKGSIKINEKPSSKKCVTNNHNKKKQYIIEDGVKCDFLELLQVMNKDGKVFSQKYDKFKQINKFLEIVHDSLKDKNINDNFKIIDFGCGKAYLTFALYYYFYNIRNISVDIIGLDLKSDVIDYCNEVARKLNYSNLKFIHGDICDFENSKDVDMIVTLHACDTATDAALVKAIKWNCEIILSVPCCQHEFYDKINNSDMMPMLKHGIVKERISSLVTDSLRSLFLESNGYKVSLLEFISMDHTPKNIMIRGVKVNKDVSKSKKEYKEFKRAWNLDDLFIEKYFEK